MIDLDPTTKPTLSVEEFAIAAGIARSTAFVAVHNGEVPSMRFGRRIRIPTAAVRRMLELDERADQDPPPAVANTHAALGAPRGVIRHAEQSTDRR